MRTEQLEFELARLGRVEAPPGLLDAVLDASGVGDVHAVVATALGPLEVACRRSGITAAQRASDPERFEEWYLREMGRRLRRVPELPRSLATAVAAHVSGRSRRHLRFDLAGLTGFQRSVLEVTAQIPRGEVRPYAWVAREVGRPDAVRAVGTALGRNPIPFLIPCHRVVRSDGTIGEYSGGGPDVKREVLTAEGLEPRLLDGPRLVGSATTRIYCYPSCHQARRITSRHRLVFGSAAAATGAGLRPCRSCRPV